MTVVKVPVDMSLVKMHEKPPRMWRFFVHHNYAVCMLCLLLERKSHSLILRLKEGNGEVV